jgi:sugar/nucleoside kinase (ribokinase family)
MKILVCGSANIDDTYQVPHFVREGETLSSEGYTRNAGGKGLNQAIALSRAGAEVCFAGGIGRDGMFLMEELKLEANCKQTFGTLGWRRPSKQITLPHQADKHAPCCCTC